MYAAIQTNGILFIAVTFKRFITVLHESQIIVNSSYSNFKRAHELYWTSNVQNWPRNIAAKQ